jgi:hypothetical protein
MLGGLLDRASRIARVASRSKNPRINADDNILLEGLVGKYSKYRRALNDRRLVVTDQGLYFFEFEDLQPQDSAPTEAVFWKNVILVDMQRSVTGMIVVDMVVNARLYRMRTVSFDFHSDSGASTMWNEWHTCFRQQAEDFRFRMELTDEMTSVEIPERSFVASFRDSFLGVVRDVKDKTQSNVDEGKERLRASVKSFKGYHPRRKALSGDREDIDSSYESRQERLARDSGNTGCSDPYTPTVDGTASPSTNAPTPRTTSFASLPPDPIRAPSLAVVGDLAPPLRDTAPLVSGAGQARRVLSCEGKALRGSPKASPSSQARQLGQHQATRGTDRLAVPAALADPVAPIGGGSKRLAPATGSRRENGGRQDRSGGSGRILSCPTPQHRIGVEAI